MKYQHDQKEIQIMKETGLANFEMGYIEGINPDMDMNDQGDLLPYNIRFEFPRENLKLEKTLGSGAFGIVVRGVATGILPYEDKTVVAVKSIKTLADNLVLKALISELKILVNLGQHLNIVNLLGAVTKSVARRELLIICEFCCFGNLLNFLQSHRKNFLNQIVNDELVQPFTSSYVPMPEMSVEKPVINMDVVLKGTEICIDSTNLISWAFQVARGMDFLASSKILHGDLAARNVLLTENNVVKICDFGLAKSLYSGYVYTRSPGTPLPLNWLALESMVDRNFSVKSDVWAYGNFEWN